MFPQAILVVVMLVPCSAFSQCDLDLPAVPRTVAAVGTFLFNPLFMLQVEGAGLDFIDGFENILDMECGNSLVERGEECDDGNAVGGDGCSSACLIEGG